MVQIIKLLEVMAQADVGFVLVGGAAAAAHGSPMVTQDLDVCGDMKPDNLRRLAVALAPFEPKHRMPPAQPPFTPEEAESGTFKNLYLQTGLGQLDFMGAIKGLGEYPEVLAASQRLPMGGFSINILSLGSLIQAKEAMGRPRDLENAEILRRLKDESN